MLFRPVMSLGVDWILQSYLCHYSHNLHHLLPKHTWMQSTTVPCVSLAALSVGMLVCWYVVLKWLFITVIHINGSAGEVAVNFSVTILCMQSTCAHLRLFWRMRWRNFSLLLINLLNICWRQNWRVVGSEWEAAFVFCVKSKNPEVTKNCRSLQ